MKNSEYLMRVYDFFCTQQGLKNKYSMQCGVKYGGSGEAERSPTSSCMPQLPAANYNFETYPHLRLWEQD